MTMEINEIGIRMRIGDDDDDEEEDEDDEGKGKKKQRRKRRSRARQGGCCGLDPEAVAADCVRRVLAILKSRQER